MNLRLTPLLAFAVGSLLAAVPTFAQTPPIYYIQQVPPQGLTLGQITSDGSGDRALNTGLPQPFGPAWSRDGSMVALTSVHPVRTNKVSQDVFAFDPAAGTTRLIVAEEDEVKIPPYFENGRLITDRSKFNYRVPIYKAFSPDGTRIAVSTLMTGGFYQGGQPNVQTLTGVAQVPMVEVYRVADGFPLDLVVAGRQRTFATLGGFGVDWHPTLDLLVVPVDVDAPTDGSLERSESSALFLTEVVPNALTTGRSRQLTFPRGSVRVDLPTVPSTIQTDYAPAFSPDGQRVAYLRAANTVEFFQGFALYQPISVAIRMVNLDGSGDHLVLQLTPGIFSSQLSWSPDGQLIVFDTGRQPTPKPLESGRFETEPGTLQLSLVNANGSNPRPLRGVSAGLPAWRPVLPTPAFRLSIRLVSGAQPSLVLTWPEQSGSVVVETTSKPNGPASWTSIQRPITSTAGQSSMTVPMDKAGAYFRARKL